MDCKSSEIAPGDIVSLVAPEPRSFTYDENDDTPVEVCLLLTYSLTHSLTRLSMLLGGPRKIHSL